jgi:hypothetical protein
MEKVHYNYFSELITTKTDKKMFLKIQRNLIKIESIAIKTEIYLLVTIIRNLLGENKVYLFEFEEY